MLEQFLMENQWVIFLIVAWTLLWKGMALWRAAKNDHKLWFIGLLAFNTLGILPILYIFIFGKRRDEKAS